jgi:hypothetical protein
MHELQRGQLTQCEIQAFFIFVHIEVGHNANKCKIKLLSSYADLKHEGERRWPERTNITLQTTPASEQ